PDILLNNADGPAPGDFRDWSRDEWIAALDAMMLSPIEMMRLTVDGMMTRGFGRIINIVSRSVKMAQLELGLSNGARSGLVGFVAGLARPTLSPNVTINKLFPGIFYSDPPPVHVGALVVTAGKTLQETWRPPPPAQPRQTLWSAERTRRLLRVFMLATRRFHHRAESADRWRQLSGDLLKGPSHETCHYAGVGARARRVHHSRRARAGLPVPHGHRGGAISGRRIGRRGRAHPGPEAQ